MIQERDAHGRLTGAPMSVDERSDSVDLGAMLLQIRAGRKKIALTSALAFLAAVVLAFLLPAQYTSTASLIPPSTTGGSSAAALMGQLSALGAGGLLGGATKSSGDLYLGLLKSRFIAQYMVNHFDLLHVYGEKKNSAAEKQLAKHSDFAVGTKDSIITISVTDRNPGRARDLAQGYLDALSTLTSGLALTESSQRRLFYEQRLAHEKDDLANAEVALKQIQEKSGLIAPAGQTAAEIQSIAQLRAQVGGREVQLAALLHDETEENPDVIRLRREIADLQGQLGRLENGSGRGVGNIATDRVPELALEYIRKERDVKYHETLFEIIAKQYEAARLDEARDTPLQVLDHPLLPDTRSGPSRLGIMLGGLLLGVLLGVVWVLVKSWQSAAQGLTLTAAPESAVSKQGTLSQPAA